MTPLDTKSDVTAPTSTCPQEDPKNGHMFHEKPALDMDQRYKYQFKETQMNEKQSLGVIEISFSTPAGAHFSRPKERRESDDRSN